MDDSQDLIDSYEQWQDNVFGYLEKSYKAYELGNQIDDSHMSNIGKYILNFYKDQSFSNAPFRFATKFETSKSEVVLEEKQTELCRAHFFKVFNLVSKTNTIFNVWKVNLTSSQVGLSGEGQFKRSFQMCCRHFAKSTNFFMKDASLVLFSNYKNELDPIEFEMYKGERRSQHLHKQCYLPRLHSDIKNSDSKFTEKCYKEYLLHSLRQLNKAKELGSDFTFRYQVKLGNFYLVNVPGGFLRNENNGTTMRDLRAALNKRYKAYNLNYNNRRGDDDVEAVAKEMIVIEAAKSSDNESKDESEIADLVDGTKLY